MLINKKIPRKINENRIKSQLWEVRKKLPFCMLNMIFILLLLIFNCFVCKWKCCISLPEAGHGWESLRLLPLLLPGLQVGQHAALRVPAPGHQLLYINYSSEHYVSLGPGEGSALQTGYSFMLVSSIMHCVQATDQQLSYLNCNNLVCCTKTLLFQDLSHARNRACFIPDLCY